ncbi:hypothetical protein CC86DRAFT_427235 [Ophiobolus disseminans]|uniref:Deoxyribonuclease NucA/NucB domain-containing protein n=1 Tax=Ophiobolus disseminans TaxID=1469910 RepID=A0A6A6ZK67_9PLEO|nr:hypothetical protein CC86DRAFT_427235 [Ophiobolus disseminans]
MRNICTCDGHKLTKSTGCQAGATCIAAGLCQRSLPSTSRLVATLRSSASSAARITPSPIVSPSPTRSPSAAGPSIKRPKSTSSCTSPPASAPTGAGAWEWIRVDGEKDCVPVLDFKCVDDLFDQMCTSMCQGIREQEKSNPERVLSDRAILLHRRNGRTAAAGCRNMGCAQRVTYSALYNQYFSMQCDEFPPASTLEGGGPTLVCISWYQNILGGSYLRYFYSDVSLASNAPFVIRMDTCAFPSTPVSFPQGQQPAVPVKRQLTPDAPIIRGAAPALYVRDPISEDHGFVFMPLAPGTPGRYNGTLGFSETLGLSDISIIDGAGDVVWKFNGTWISGTRDVAFDVKDDTQDLSVAARVARSVSIGASFTATGVAGSKTAVGDGGRRSVGVVWVWVGVLVGVLWS